MSTNEDFANGMKAMMSELQKNYSELLTDWNLLQDELAADKPALPPGYVMVSQSELTKLSAETMQLRQNLPKVLNSGFVEALRKVDSLHQEVSSLKASRDDMETMLSRWKSRCETAVSDCQREKEEMLKLLCEVQELSDQLGQQTEYCTSLGAACCTLLWRVSRCEESIQSILVGTKVDEFLSLVGNTLDSYVSAYKDEWPADQSDETHFILALCGIITNVAASAYGREFLVTNVHGRSLIDTYTNFILEAPARKSARLKNLILMSLYNLTINQKGLKYIRSKTGIMGLLAWHLQEETDIENRVNTLRIIQSLIYEDNNLTLFHELQEALPSSLLQQLSVDRNKDLKELSLELISDLRHIHTEP